MDTNISYLADAEGCPRHSRDSPKFDEQEIVQLSLNEAKTFLWLNSENGCLFRACRAKTITVLTSIEDPIVMQAYDISITPCVNGFDHYSHLNIVVYLGQNSITITSEHGRLLFIKSKNTIEYTV